jgi:hypothetical protein
MPPLQANRHGSVICGVPVTTVEYLSPAFRISLTANHSDDGRFKIRCRCDQLIDLA